MFSINLSSNNKFEPWKKDFWLKILVMAIAICIVCYVWGANEPSTDGPYIAGPLYAILLAIVISVLNGFIKPVLSLFSMPMIISTLGLFMLVINAIIIMIAAWLMGDTFDINGFGNALLFSIMVSVLNFILDIPRRIKRISDNLKSKYDPYRENNPEREEATFTEYEDVTEEQENNN